MRPYHKEIADRLDALSIEDARIEIASGAFGDIGSPNHAVASALLAAKEASLRDAKERELAALLRANTLNERAIADPASRSSISAEAWTAIEKEYGVTKMTFGKKINFVRDRFRKEIIFRDVGQAHALALKGFNKPSVVLSGSVIEEILRLYLLHKNITPARNNLDSYIKACEENELLKGAIHRLADSVRQFRNVVHLEKEISARHSISKATAMAAVASIFTIANDLV